MKTIENKLVTVNGKDVTYADLTKEHLKAAPQGGFTYDLMAKVGRVLPKLEAGGETIELEDADFEFLKEKITTTTWAFYDVEFVKMIDYIKSL